MATTNGTMEGDTASIMTPPNTFSYAQAAKGKAPPSSAATTQPSETPSISSKPSKESVSSPSPLEAGETKFKWADDAADANTVVEDNAHTETKVDVGEVANSPKPVANGTKEDQTSNASSPDFGASHSSSTAKDDEHLAPFANPTELSWRRRPQNDRTSDASSPLSERKEKSPEKTPAKQLVEAPAPTINFWIQRAQDVKFKQPLTSQPGPSQSTTITKTASGQASSKAGVASLNAPTPSEGSTNRAPPPDASSRRTSHPRNATDNGPVRQKNSAPRRQSADSKPQRPSKSEPPMDQSQAPQARSLQDAQSWPTPETAQDKERRKSGHEKNERPEDKVTTPAKPHGKNEKWVTVPFTPTVKFETPLPPLGTRRGGRVGTRGGRELGSRGGLTHSSTKSTTTDASPADESNGMRNANESSTARVSSSPNRRRTAGASELEEQTRSKRSTAPTERLVQGKDSTQRGSARSQDSRDKGAAIGLNRTPSEDIMKGHDAGPVTTAQPIPGIHDTGTTPYFAQAPMSDPRPRRKNSRAADTESIGFRNGERRRSNSINGSGKSNMYDRRVDTMGRPYDSRDSSNTYAQRERGEVRYERGRGGRPRGGIMSHAPINTQQMPNGPMISTSTSQPLSARSVSFQQGYTATFPGPRGSRGNAHRPASIPSDFSYSRYAAGYPITPAFSPYPNSAFEYGTMPQMSPAAQYSPYISQMMPQMMLMNSVAGQLNYYFSVDNLCKDMYLRKHMDSQGFVPLKLIADFKRMKDLTTDSDIIKSIAVQSPEYEVRTNPEGQHLLRKSEAWEKFVLAIDDRDPAARHEGPPASAQPQQAVEQHDTVGYRHPAEAMFRPVPTAMYQQRASPVQNAPQTNGFSSSAVVEKSTSPAHTQEQQAQKDQLHVAADSPTLKQGTETPAEEPDTFPDDKIDYLTVVVRPQTNGTSHQPESSRSFSNGSLEGLLSNANGGPEERQPRSLVKSNESDDRDHSARIADIKKSLTSPTTSHRSPSHRSNSSNPSSIGLFWIKEQGEDPEQLPSNSTYEPYGQVCANATEQRRSAAPGDCPYDMSLLYQFWSHFLLRNFNTRMYMDFRTFAHEDATQKSHVGLTKLIKFYGESMLSPRTMRKLVAQDYVKLVQSESGKGDRPAFKQLRAAWRNGAFNLKNRKIITDLIDRDLQTELDR